MLKTLRIVSFAGVLAILGPGSVWAGTPHPAQSPGTSGIETPSPTSASPHASETPGDPADEPGVEEWDSDVLSLQELFESILRRLFSGPTGSKLPF